jgi:hypothetical protein
MVRGAAIEPPGIVIPGGSCTPGGNCGIWGALAPPMFMVVVSSYKPGFL